MNKKIVGGALCIIGAVGGVLTYSYRPPSSFEEIIAIAAQNSVYLQKPAYIGAWVIVATVVAVGIYLIRKK